MKVFFLGAGASIPAGYPAVSNLLDVVFDHAQESRDVSVRDTLDKFNRLVQGQTGIPGYILNNPNPEVVLSLPELCMAALESSDIKRWRSLKNAWLAQDEESISELQKELDHPDREGLDCIRRIRDLVLRMLEHFFGFLHYEDSKQTNFPRRKYLRDLCTDLSNGDVVVTTNWDTLAERTLMEAEKWTLSDGYGFPVQLIIDPSIKSLNGHLVEVENTKRSKVLVLKLHGSFGWKMTDDSFVHVENAGYLQYLPSPLCDYFSMVIDKKAPSLPSAFHEMAAILPSLIKTLEGAQFQSIWNRASWAIGDADEVVIIGSSLSIADVGVRVLMSPLAKRIRSDGVNVTVVNPDKYACETWLRFLGDGITLVEGGIKEYVEQR